MKRALTLVFSFLILFNAFSQPVTSTEIDSIVSETMKVFNVPGIAVAVIKDDRVIHLKGYGVRSINAAKTVDENTLFAIASNTKAFTAAALGILVDEGRISWDEKVINVIPEFRLYNAYVTEEFTIRDLLTHRSGMGLGAGDLMLWPDSSAFTREEIIHNLRFLKPVSSFRTKYDYDNLLYIVAGEVIARVSGVSWEEFIETRIMKPLGMNMSAASIYRLKDDTNIIDAHVPVNGKLVVVSRYQNDNINPAGGIFSNISDLSKWVIMQINNGKYGEGFEKQLFSEDVHSEMWTPQTIIPVRGRNSYNTNFASYGLGWFLSDVKGYKQASHTGGLAGIVTQVTIVPDLKLGIIVLTNQQSGAAFTAITNTIKDGYLGVTGHDRIKEMKDQAEMSEKEGARITNAIWSEIKAQQKNKPACIDPVMFTGTYTDNWFGDIIISVKNNKLWFDSEMSPRCTGEMFYYKGNTFIVRWNDRSMDADAFAVFTYNAEGQPNGLTMQAISPLTDFSYDFQDLNFIRKSEK